MEAPTRSYREYNCYFYSNRDGYWSEYRYFASPNYGNTITSSFKEFDMSQNEIKKQ